MSKACVRTYRLAPGGVRNCIGRNVVKANIRGAITRSVGPPRDAHMCIPPPFCPGHCAREGGFFWLKSKEGGGANPLVPFPLLTLAALLARGVRTEKELV